MRILDEEDDKKLDYVTIYLTQSEAKELRDSIAALCNDRHLHHVHVSAEDLQKEITVCVYSQDELGSFDDRSKRLILKDE